jgi:glycosyltransferase involved in cell wall biosynthesis
MTTLSALIVAHNEELFIEDCIKRIIPFVEEIIVVNHGSVDGTVSKIPINDKIKIFDYPYYEPVDMGAIRTFALEKSTRDWFIQVDADEYYPSSSLQKIRQKIENPGQAISFRVPYYNLAWIKGYAQVLDHFPDRIYRKDVVDRYEGILPNDMTLVKREYYQYRPFLEYDNERDESFENPKQPIIQAPFYHLARTRGYNYEYNKWLGYNRNLNPNKNENEIREQAIINQWVTGLYDMKRIYLPPDIPAVNIPNPKVSVVIPNFQYANYVGDAINSCLVQTVLPFEIIVVDDRSHDNSIEVISKYPVKLIALKENGGVSNTRNIGAKEAVGDYLIFLDADDMLAPTFIEETLKEIKGGDYQIVSTDLEFFGDQQGIVNYPTFTSAELKKYQIIPSACALLSRRVFEASGGFNNNLVYEDWGFWLHLDKLGFKFKQIKKPLFKYRKHGKSRIDLLDENQVFGFNQLKELYGITREPDKK